MTSLRDIDDPSPAYRALVAERYGRSTWFTARVDNSDGPTTALMACEQFEAACGQRPRPVEGLDDIGDDGATMSEGRSRVNGTSPLGTTSTDPKGT